MHRVASWAFLVVLPTVLAAASTAVAPSVAHAQPEADAERARLAAAYAAAPTLSNACSLAEGERRAGLVDDAARRLDAALRGQGNTEPSSDEERATLSACHFNRARIHEDRGELPAAYEHLAAALSTPIATRRRIVEQRLVDVAARLVTAEGCRRLSSEFSAHALLRFADSAVLRRCVDERRRVQPFCVRTAPGDVPDTQHARDGYGTRRVDANTVVIQDDHFIVVVTRRGARASAFECRLPVDEEGLQFARVHDVSGVRVFEITTIAFVSYACTECEEGDDCRCSDQGQTTYFLGARGELLLVLTPAWVEPGNMAALNSDTAELHDTAETATAVDGRVLVVNGRRLRLVRGALVPAP